MRRIRFSGIVGLSSLAGLLVLGCALFACNPEPGPIHFPPPPEPPVPVGYFEVFNTLNGLPGNQVRAVLNTEDGVLVGVEGCGLLIYRKGAWRQFTASSTPPFPAATIAAFTPIPDSEDVMAGTIAGIVKIGNLRGDVPTFDPVKTKNAPSVNFLSLMQTETNLFGGTDNSAGEATNGIFRPFTVEGEKYPTGFGCISKHDEEVWFGTSAGLYKLSGNRIQPVFHPGMDFGWVQGLEILGTDLLIGGSKGMYLNRTSTCSELLPGLWTTRLGVSRGSGDLIAKMYFQEAGEDGSLAVPATFTRAALHEQRDALGRLYTEAMKDSSKFPAYMIALRAYDLLLPVANAGQNLLKGLWIGTQDSGLVFYGDDFVRRYFTTDNSKLPNNRITAVDSASTGETWIGTFDGGLLHYRAFSIATDTPVEQVWAGRATTLRILSDYLYVGTGDKGLLVFDPKSLNAVGVYDEARIPGFHRKVTGVAVDQQANLWVSGDKGVWRIGAAGNTRFTSKDGLPADDIPIIEIDPHGRIFAGGGGEGEISAQIAAFNGASFTCYTQQNLRDVLAMSPASATAFLQALGLAGSYQCALDTSDPEKALKKFDDMRPAGKVCAMLGHRYFLVIGTTSGELFVFDGQGFKRLSKEVSGSFGRIVRLKGCSNGRIVIVGEKVIQTHNGDHWVPVNPPASPPVDLFTDAAVDDRNGQLFWASYKGRENATSGIALNEDLKWNVLTATEPVLLLAPNDPYMFFATEKGVFRRSLH